MPESEMQESEHRQEDKNRWSLVLPYYNERDYITKTLASLAEQRLKPFTLILIDNASTDGTEEVARRFLAHHPDITAVFLSEPRPGKSYALERGLAAVKTAFVATCDADVLYPPAYLETCDRIYRERGASCAAVLGLDLYAPIGTPQSRRRMRKWRWKITFHPLRQNCHSGAYAQTFRTAALRQAGGYDMTLWPYIFGDHEIINRVRRVGRVVHSPAIWCYPADRRPRSKKTTITLVEKILYRYTPACSKDWYFHSFLARRFARRGALVTNLRHQAWQDRRADGTTPS